MGDIGKGMNRAEIEQALEGSRKKEVHFAVQLGKERIHCTVFLQGQNPARGSIWFGGHVFILSQLLKVLTLLGASEWTEMDQVMDRNRLMARIAKEDRYDGKRVQTLREADSVYPAGGRKVVGG